MTARSPVGPGRPRGNYTQARRLLELYDRLHRGRTLISKELADELGVDERTLQRDRKLLSEVLGARVEQVGETGESGSGIRLATQQRTPDIFRRLGV
ncbi:MAG: HTH domain-containing protein [Deltaproteobacteria bacterium]|nr:HTH domain-containing protein [Deltaproteobacteria bacterium]